MSTTVDSRVVSMQFDNKQFEQNVAVSMSTLDKLKQKLNFSGAEKGLDNVSAAAKNVNMTGLANSVETVSAKFSALQVMGVTALANITNSAVNAGKRMVSALTIDPVKTGFNEYELKMNSVQTIMASTGESIQTVNRYLEELNTYSDQTIYSFSDMTQNIGKFTNAGVKLEDAVAAIKGISNEAALSGANANEASRAMYNFSQALSAGYVKLIDWKSIENANMATKGFKDELIKTALEMGTVTEAADGMYTTLNGTAFNATKNFNETLQDQWMTSEVLINTLKKYADETTDIGKQASAAATEVKTFTQLWDTLKESAQSGWAKTWELLVGDLLEAKSLLTGISKVVGGFIDRMNDWRNNILEKALGSPFKGLQEGLEKVLAPAKKVTESIEGTKKLLEDIEYMANRVIRGDFGNGADRIEAFEKLGLGLENYHRVQNKVNELMGDSTRHAVEEVDAQEAVTEAKYDSIEALMELSDAQLKDLGLKDKEIESLRSLAEYSEKTGISIKELSEDLSLLDGRNLLINSFKNIFGKTFGSAGKDIIDRETYESFEKAGVATKEWREQMVQAAIDGERLTKVEEGIYKIGETTYTTNQLFNEGLKENWLLANKTYSGLAGVLQIVKEAWHSIFPPKSAEERAKSLYDIIAAFHKFTTSLKMDSETVENLRKTFAGLFALLDIILTLTSGPLKIAFTILKEILAMFDLDILDVTAAIGDAIVNFRDWIKENNFLTKALEKLKPIIVGFVQAIRDWIDGFTKADNKLEYVKQSLSNLGDIIKQHVTDAFENLSDIFENWIEKIPGGTKALSALKDAFAKISEFITKSVAPIKEWLDGIKDAENIPKYIFQGLINGLKTGISTLWNAAMNIGKTIVDAIKTFLGIHSPSTVMIAIGGFIIAGLLIGLKDKLGGLWDVLSAIGAKLVEWIKEVDFGTILAAAITGGMVIAGLKIASALKNLTAPLDGLGDMFGEIGNAAKRMSKGVANYFNSKAVLNMAFAIGVLAASVALLTLVDQNKMWQAVGAIGALVVALGLIAGIAALMNKLGGAGDVKGYVSMVVNTIAVAAAIAILAVTLKQIAEVNLGEDIWKKLGVLGAAVGIMVVIAALFGALGKFGMTSGIPSAVIGLVGLSFAINIMVGVIKNAGALKESEIQSATAALMLVGELFFSFIAVSWLAGFAAGKAGSMLLKASVAMLIMVGVMKVAAMLREDEVKKATEVIISIGKIFIAMIAVSALAGFAAGKAGSMLLKASLAMLVMVGVIKLAAGIDDGTVEKAMNVIMTIGGMFTTLIAVSLIAGANARKAGSMLLQASVALLIMVGVIAIIGVIKQETLDKAFPVILGIMACFAALILCLGILRGQNVSDIKGVLITMTVIIGLIVGALVGLSFIPAEDLIPAAIALGAVLVAVFAALAIVMRQAKGLKKTTGPMLALSLIFVALGAALAVLSQMPMGGVIAAAGSLAGVMIALAIVLAIIKKMNLTKTGAQKLERGVRALVGVTAALVVVAGALLLASKVSHSGERALVLTAMLYAMWPLLTLLRRMNLTKTEAQKLERGIRALVGVAVAMMAFAGALMLVGNVRHLGEKALVLTAMMYAMWGLLKLLQMMKLTKTEAQKLERGIRALIGVAVALAALVGVLILMGLVEYALNRAVVLTGFAYAMMGLLYALKPIGKHVKDALFGVLSLGALAVALAALVGVLLLMGLVEHAVERAVVLTLFAYAMMALIYALKPIGKHFGEAIRGVIALAAIAIPLFLFVEVLRNLQGIDVATGSLIALVTLIGVATLVVAALALLPIGTDDIDNMAVGILALCAVCLAMHEMVSVLERLEGVEVATETLYALESLIIVLTAVVAALALLPLGVDDIDNLTVGIIALCAMAIPLLELVGILYLAEGIDTATETVDALTTLLTAMTLLLIPLVAVGAVNQLLSGSLLAGILALVAMGVPLLELVGILYLAEGLDVATSTVDALTTLMTAMTLLLIPLAAIGALGALTGGIIYTGILALVAMGVPLLEFVGILYLMEGLNDAEKNVDILIRLMTAMEVMLGVVAILGPMAIVGEAALVGLVALITGVGALAIAIGALFEHFPALKEFMNSGIALLEDLAYSIGSMIGNMLAGFGDAVSASLPAIGTALTDFMNNAKGFIDGCKAIDDKVLSGAANLAGAILAIVGASFFKDIVNLLPGIGDLQDMGSDLSGFMANASGFINGAKMIDSKLVSGIESLAGVIMTLTAANLIDGITSFITGGASLASFGSQLTPLGEGVAGFVTKLKDGGFTTDDVEICNAAANVIAKLAGIDIPNEGGFISWIVGDNTLDGFAAKLAPAAEGIVDFVSALRSDSFTLTADDMTIAENAANLISKMASISIPNEGGFLSWIVGDNTLDGFADKLAPTASGIVAFVKTLKSDKFTLTESDVSLAKNAASLISSLASVTVPTDGGFINWIKGQQSLDDFASKLPKVATAVVDFCNTLNNKEFTLGQGQMSIATNAATMVSSLAGIKVPDDGGFFGWVTGKQGLDDFAKKLPTVAKGIKSFVTGLDGITVTQAQNAANCASALNGLANIKVADIDGLATKLENVGKNIGAYVRNGMILAETEVNKGFTQMLTSLSIPNTVFESYSLVGEMLAGEVGGGMLSAKKDVKSDACDLLKSVASTMKTWENTNLEFQAVGKHCVQGFANGMSNNKSIATAAAEAVANAAAAAAEAALDINSPSKVFMGIGHSVDEGFAMGITKYSGEVNDSINGVADSAIKGMTNAVSGIADAINTDIDSQPIIRPVLDLTDVESKAGRIGGLLNGQSLAVSANAAGSISSMMNLRSQNGSNDDIISALKDLRGDLANRTGDTYQINGVTYDDGSNIRAFAEAVIRQSRVGRRV